MEIVRERKRYPHCTGKEIAEKELARLNELVSIASEKIIGIWYE